MPGERDIQNEILSIQQKQGEKLSSIFGMLSGVDGDRTDTGIKGDLQHLMLQLHDFDISDFKANTKYRENKESEMSRITIGIIILLVNIFASGMIGMLFKVAVAK